MQQHANTYYVPSDPRGLVKKVKTFLSEGRNVANQEHIASTYSVHTHTHTRTHARTHARTHTHTHTHCPWGGVKLQHNCFFSEISHVAYQLNGNGA